MSLKRWWGVRHLRYWWHKRAVYNHAQTMADFGLGLGEPNIHDLIQLELIWRGKR